VCQYAHLARLRRFSRRCGLGSLLAYRLRRRRLSRLYSEAPPARKKPVPRATKDAEDLEPVDRTWLSDLPLDKAEENVEGTRPARIQSDAGGLLDIWF
jgi:hypothetical protein